MLPTLNSEEAIFYFPTLYYRLNYGLGSVSLTLAQRSIGREIGKIFPFVGKFFL